MKTLLRLLCLVLCLAMLPALPLQTASADVLYLIADSDTAYLTEEDVWKWDRESLPYLWNEILARHGYVFNAGSQYDLWFRSEPWYTPNDNPDNEHYCYPQLSSQEWANVDLIKAVAKKMDAIKEDRHIKGRKCYRDFTPPGDWALTGFTLLQGAKAGQTVPVYSAPSTSAYRSNNGKASVSTNGAVWAAGWENGWLLVFYETNGGSVRVGYAKGLSGKISVNCQLNFDKVQTVTTRACDITDDPVRMGTTMGSLAQGASVVYLTTLVNQNGEAWDYVETTVSGRVARGFIYQGSLALNYDEETGS